MAFLFEHHTKVDTQGHIVQDGKPPLQAPEINPSDAGTALLLLAGALAVICGKIS